MYVFLIHNLIAVNLISVDYFTQQRINLSAVIIVTFVYTYSVYCSLYLQRSCLKDERILHSVKFVYEQFISETSVVCGSLSGLHFGNVLMFS